MKSHLSGKFFGGLLLALCCAVPTIVNAAVADLANSPLANGLSSSTTVKPNIAFVVDDSGSMDYQNMPNDDGDDKSNRCWGWNKYNTLFYDPTYRYKPPFNIDGALYSDGVRRFPDSNFDAALKDGYFPSGGYTFSGNATSNTSTVLGTLSNLTPNSVSCIAADKAQTTIRVSGNGSTSVSQISVGGTNIMSGATTASSDSNTVASRVAAKIAANGYSATSSGNTITIRAPLSAGDVTATPVVTSSGGKTFSSDAFADYAANECPSSPSKYYYSRHKSSDTSSTCEADSQYDIVTDPNKIAGPDDPATGTRTASQIAAAKTNYANWFTYYRRRALLMKAATGEAFKDLDESKYRVGLFFINSVQSQAGNTTVHDNNDFKIDNFSGSATGTQRYEWYAKLYGSRSDGSTPLRGALARMGQMYAGKINGWDPVQYSCQQNFTILSTDGFWNTGSETTSYGPKKIDGSTNVGNADGPGTAAIAAKATITVTGSNTNTSISQIRVGSIDLMNEASAASKDNNTVAENIRTKIVNGGFTATRKNNVVTIIAPLSLTGLSVTPSFTIQSGSKTLTATAFDGFIDATTGAPLPYKDVKSQSNTLADVGYYYYQTDLRDESLGNCSNTIGSTTFTALCENNVRGSGKDLNSKQHMTSFTIGLGVSGTVQYQSDYESAPKISGKTTYADIADGSADWPVVVPSSDTDLGKVDDLWHAAVNGRGTYYSAMNANSLKEGIQSALAGVQAQTGSSAAAATSSLQPVAGDNYAYVALYQTLKWDGDLKAYAINPSDGTITGGALWSARDQLDAQVSTATSPADGRTIKYFSSGAAGKLKEFTYANLEADGLQNSFDAICDKTPVINQCGSDGGDLTTLQRTAANSGANLVGYLRGLGLYESETGNATTANRLYRGREHVLGDIVNAVPVFARKPPFNYDAFDDTYGTFKADNAGRAANVYVAANDGMLHAFNAGNGTTTSDGNEGKERWAYVPQLIMSNLWHLADTNYGDAHRYFVDGSPVLADICDSLSSADPKLCAAASNWKTILVGGLNKGGCGYYALDVTDPNSPKGLWEFSNENLGYSFGNPIVTKNKAGKWIVIVSSGYNNYSGNGCGTSGDGNGHVFVLDAATGVLLNDIPTYISGTTPAGTTSAPSGLGQLNAWIDDTRLAVADRVYGGDMRGNVWRVDFDNNHEPSGNEAVLIAQLKDNQATPVAQPITVRPELAEVTVGASKYPVVMVGTGKYLGDSDLNDLSQQTIYAVKDTLASTNSIAVRGGTLKSRTLTQINGTTGGALDGRIIRTISGDTINWATDNGWYVDFNPASQSPGERINVQMSLDSSILTLATNVPFQNACNVGGYAFLYSLDINNGKNLANAVDGAAGVRLSGNALVAGIRTITLPSGKKTVVITDTAGGISSDALPSSGDGKVGAARRTTWREIVD